MLFSKMAAYITIVISTQGQLKVRNRSVRIADGSMKIRRRRILTDILAHVNTDPLKRFARWT